jgi:hypothetical protein
MNSTPTIRALTFSASISILALTAGSTFAQQTTGTPGSPSATTTIDGKYLPLFPCHHIHCNIVAAGPPANQRCSI